MVDGETVDQKLIGFIVLMRHMLFGCNVVSGIHVVVSGVDGILGVDDMLCQVLTGYMMYHVLMG